MRTHTLIMVILAVLLGLIESFGQLVSNLDTAKAGGTGWTERILKDDGTINWAEYDKIATHAGELNERDYLLGPKYGYYHPQAESFPTLALQGGTDGWEGPVTMKPPVCLTARNTDWYAQAGPLLYVADDPNNAGVIEAANGESYIYPSTVKPPYGFWCKAYWNEGSLHRYTFSVPPELAEPDWHSPKKPIAVASATGMAAAQAIYVAFENGFIGTVPVDPCEWTYINNGVGNNGSEQNYAKAYSVGPNKNIFPCVQLPAGKVPMALAVTPCGEFVLAAVWDVINHKGQLAVIAVQGRVRCS
ncbi:MAG: hypothetical protein P4N59_13625, partial [Negativicutes bacterium]|nr:hypothetical protein [Negativicutes bacterium]